MIHSLWSAYEAIKWSCDLGRPVLCHNSLPVWNSSRHCGTFHISWRIWGLFGGCWEDSESRCLSNAVLLRIDSDKGPVITSLIAYNYISEFVTILFSISYWILVPMFCCCCFFSFMGHEKVSFGNNTSTHVMHLLWFSKCVHMYYYMSGCVCACIQTQGHKWNYKHTLTRMPNRHYKYKPINLKKICPQMRWKKKGHPG